MDGPRARDVRRLTDLDRAIVAVAAGDPVAPAAERHLRVADERADVSEAVSALMGSKPEARFRFIQERAAFAKDLDI